MARPLHSCLTLNTSCSGRNVTSDKDVLCSQNKSLSKTAGCWFLTMYPVVNQQVPPWRVIWICLGIFGNSHEISWKLLNAHTWIAHNWGGVQVPCVRVGAKGEVRRRCRLSLTWQHVLSLSKADPTTAPVECSTCTQPKSTANTQYVFIPQGHQINFMWLFPLQKGHWCVLTGIIIYSTYGLPVPVCSVSSCTIIQVWAQCLIYENSVLYNIFDQLTHSKVKDMQLWAPDYSMHLFTVYCIIQK